MNSTIHPLRKLDGHINTMNGKINLLDPKIDQIYIDDIASSLAAKPHFGGFCNPWFSIAQHSELVMLLAIKAEEPMPVIQAALLHDASEAYLSDIVKPLKIQPEFEGYRKLEKIWMKTIFTKYNLEIDLLQKIKPYDLCIQEMEYEKFFKGNNQALDELVGDKYFTPDEAYDSFMRWFRIFIGKGDES